MDADNKSRGDVSLELVCHWTSYCTHHSDMDAPQYVHVDKFSDVPFSWTFSYTIHTYVDAPQHVHVDVPLGYFYDFDYTHHSDMDAPLYVLVDVPQRTFSLNVWLHITTIWTLPCMYTMVYL
jgi:hypothetical protein